MNAFGLYHSAWLFLLFLALICFRPDALLIILGVFGGIMYNFIEPAGMYFYPWDMPALFFFTLACLLFLRGRIGILVPVVILGSLFKETVLCCSLFILLGNHWTWPKRIAGFLGVIVATLALNNLLMTLFQVEAPALAMNGATTLSGLLHHTLLVQNLNLLFSLNPNHVLFVNAGSLVIALLIPWRSRADVLFKLVILLFAAGQFLYGIIDEVRVWYELLPLGWIMISEALARPRLAPPDSALRPFKASYLMALAGLAFVILALFVTVKLDPDFAPKPGPIVVPIPEALLTAAQNGEAEAQFKLGSFLVEQRRDMPAACEWFRKAADQGHPMAQYRLAVNLWNGVLGDPDYDTALRLLRASASHGKLEAMVNLGRIYQQTKGVTPDLVESYKWIRLATILKGVPSSGELQQCAEHMTPDQITAAENLAQAYVKTNPLPALSNPN